MYKFKNKKINSTNGFTLVETMVVIFIFSLLALGISQLSNVIFKDIKQNMSSLDNLDSARSIASKFTNEIRSASYGNDGGYPLYQVGNSQIIFYSNYGQSPNVVAKIRYFLSGTTLKKGVIVPTTNPVSYSSLLEKITNVQYNVKNSILFYYYNGDYTGSSSTSPLSQPVNVNEVKYISIKMDVPKQNNSTSTDIFTVSAGAAIRNLKTNLGN